MLVVMITLRGSERATLLGWEEDEREEGGQKKDGARVEQEMDENNDKAEEEGEKEKGE